MFIVFMIVTMLTSTAHEQVGLGYIGHAFAEGSLAAVPTGLEVVGDEPLPVVATVVGDLVRGHVLAVGGALVVPAMTPLVGQAAHGDEGEGAGIAELNLPAWVSLVEGAELHVGGWHQVSIVESLREVVKIG